MSNNVLNSRRPIPSLFCLKALCALFVVIIHSHIWGKDALAPVWQVAVPCFFAISGYFLFSGNPEKEARTALRWAKKGFILQIFLLFVYWSFFKIYNHTEYVWQTYVIALLSGVGIVAHLWYLAALWQALVIFALIRRWVGNPAVIIIMCLLADRLVQHYLLPLCPFNASLLKVACFSSLVYICGGYAVAKYKGECSPLSLLLGLVILGLIPEFCGVSALLPTAVRRVFHVAVLGVISASLVAACVKKPECSLPWVAWIGKNHAANIYYYHIIISTMLPDVARRLFGIDTTLYSAWVTFPLALLLSVIIVAVSSRVKRFVDKRRAVEIPRSPGA